VARRILTLPASVNSSRLYVNPTVSEIQALMGREPSYIGHSREASGSGKYVSSNRIEFTTDNRNQVRVLLIIDDDRAVGHTFVLPRTGYAIYRQSQGQWKQERIESRNSKISLQLDSPDGQSIDLRLQGPCCSSMAETSAPYH
jgi:hypothetical protein